MLKFYVNKIPNSNVMIPLKALTYFDDINFNETIVMLNFDYNWEKVSERLINMTKEPNKIFEKLQ